MKPHERGITLVEVLVAAGVIAAVLLVAVMAMHVAVSAVPSTNGQVADAVNAVASDARAAISYGDGSGQMYGMQSWQ